VRRQHIHPHLGGPVLPAAVVAAQQLDRRVSTAAILFGSLFSMTSLIMFATGNERAGYMMGVAGALVGGVLGALQLLSEDA
jgi:hypothetical protein